MPESIIQMQSITKYFPGGVIANQKADFEVQVGEIHAIVGENGAGKSTLMNILYGLLQPDSGEILIDGTKVTLDSPRTAKKLGVGMVHQHFMLVPSFTVMQNIILGYEPVLAKTIINGRIASQQINELCQRYKLELPLSATTRDLSIGLQQRVEIVKALYRGARYLILDEPTSVLTPLEVEELFHMCQEMAQKGTPVIFISHKLREVLSLSDRITVMRKGMTVDTVETKSTNENQLANLIIGRNRIWTFEKHEAQANTGATLKVDNLSVRSKQDACSVKDLSLVVNSGEILGIAGVEGNGQSELAAGLAGLAPIGHGKVFLNQIDITNFDVEKRRAMGFRYIPEDRSTEGLSLASSIAENLIIDRHDRSVFVKPSGRILWDGVEKHAAEKILEYGVLAPNSSVKVAALSGGNQQKVLAARELSGVEQCLLIAHPTRGLDIGAAEFIYQRLFEVRDEGAAILLISADLDEIFLLSDRIIVLFEGQIAGEFLPEQATPENVGLCMTGAANTSYRSLDDGSE